MKKIFYILIFLILLLSVGCNKDEVISVPDLKVSANGSDILVSNGGYEWTNSNKETIVADSVSPTEIANTLSGNKVNSQSQLILNFSKRPNRVRVIPFGELKDNNFTYTDNTINLPKENGTYIYEILSYWDQGNVSYIIKVIVDNK